MTPQELIETINDYTSTVPQNTSVRDIFEHQLRLYSICILLEECLSFHYNYNHPSKKESTLSANIIDSLYQDIIPSMYNIAYQHVFSEFTAEFLRELQWGETRAMSLQAHYSTRSGKKFIRPYIEAAKVYDIKSLSEIQSKDDVHGLFDMAKLM